MGKYRKIDPRIWNDAKFAALSHEGQLLFLYILTHPSMTSLGAFRATPDGLMSEIGINSQCSQHCTEHCTSAFDELCKALLVKYDENSKTVLVPNFIKYNAPENANVVIGWGNALDQIPEGPLKLEALEKAKASVMIPKKRAKSDENTLLKAFYKNLEGQLEALKNLYKNDTQTLYGTVSSTVCCIQEQEQEQEQNIINTNNQSTVSEAKGPSGELDCLIDDEKEIFDSEDLIDCPIKKQVEAAQLNALDVSDEKRPLSVIEMITVAKTFGIKLARNVKTEAIANRRTITMEVFRECVKRWKGTNTTFGYFVSILENASNDPQSVLPNEQKEQPLTADTISDKQAGFFASRLVQDQSFCSKFGKGFTDYPSLISKVAANMRDPRHFEEYRPFMEKHGFVRSA